MIGRRMRLMPRLALGITIIIVATLLLDLALRLFITSPPVMVFSRDWLAQAIVRAARTADATPPDRRAEALAALDLSEFLDLEIEPAAPESWHADQPDAFIRLQDDVARQLGNGVRVEAVAFSTLSLWSRFRPAAIVLPELSARRLDIDTADSIIMGRLRISVPLADGQWLTMIPATGPQFPVRPILLTALGLAAIFWLSMRLARDLTRPLVQLSAAAERLGRSREPTAIPDMTLPEYAAIAASFNEMQRRIKLFIDERMQLMGAISHDLRTPLTRLRLAAEYQPDPALRQQMLSDIADMQTMVASSLAFAGDDLARESHAVADIASALISLCDQASDAGGDAVYDGPDHATLSCQPVAMRRAFANLIDNGCKYGQSVTVTLRDAPDAITVEIRDKGPGIAARDIERAFAPFQRLDPSRNRETGGTGLGLTIARDVVRGHGGEIALGPAGPVGLLVTVRLPK